MIFKNIIFKYHKNIPVGEVYFLNSILNPMTCQEGSIAGFLINSPSEVSFHFIFSPEPSKATEVIGPEPGSDNFERDLIIISCSGLPRHQA